MIGSVSRAGERRATFLGLGICLVVVIALVVVGRASAHPDVIDFRQTCSGHRADGHQHADTIYGSRICADTADTFRGLYGPDRIYGYLGDDKLLKGSKGADRVFGGLGDDWIEGSDGTDRLDGGRGSDHIEGGLDGDQIHGRSGEDKIFGQEGDDVIRGGGRADVIDCGDGVDEAWGGTGNDTFVNCEVSHQRR